MQLTLFSDYALRTLLYLGTHREQLVSVPEIARAYSISRNHLFKVLGLLNSLGLVETVRGRGGGLRLAKEPKAINLGQLIRKTEPHLHLVECFDPKQNSCVIAPACELKGVLLEAQRQFLAALDRYTLADILGKGPALQQLWKKEGPGFEA